MKNLNLKEVVKTMDRLEDIRQKAAENPSNYPTDYALRLCEAIVADFMEFEDRAEWTKLLKQNPKSRYSKRLKEGNFYI